jgi:hypothetical protein
MQIGNEVLRWEPTAVAGENLISLRGVFDQS